MWSRYRVELVPLIRRLLQRMRLRLRLLRFWPWSRLLLRLRLRLLRGLPHHSFQLLPTGTLLLNTLISSKLQSMRRRPPVPLRQLYVGLQKTTGCPLAPPIGKPLPRPLLLSTIKIHVRDIIAVVLYSWNMQPFNRMKRLGSGRQAFYTLQ